MTMQDRTAMRRRASTARRRGTTLDRGAGKLGRHRRCGWSPGSVLLYMFLPIFVIVLFSFNNPAGKFNYTWQGFTLDNWANPFKYPALAQALKMSLSVAAVSTVIASCSARCSQ